MVRSVLGRGNALIYMALAMAWSCDNRSTERETALATAEPARLTALSERDLDVYATGTRAQIGLLRAAIESGHAVGRAESDSVAARTARVSVERFQAIRTAVEAALKTQETLATRAARLDSLRVELMVLRVRAEVQP